MSNSVLGSGSTKINRSWYLTSRRSWVPMFRTWNSKCYGSSCTTAVILLVEGHPSILGVLKFWTKLSRGLCSHFFNLSCIYSTDDKDKDMFKWTKTEFQKYREVSIYSLHFTLPWTSRCSCPRLILSNTFAFCCCCFNWGPGRYVSLSLGQFCPSFSKAVSSFLEPPVSSSSLFEAGNTPTHSRNSAFHPYSCLRQLVALHQS